MYEIIALIGESGCGKDTIMQKLLQQHPHAFHEIISCTTRPPRENEIDGKNYFFLEENQFEEKIEQNQMLEYTEFNSWYYGTSFDALREDKINLGVFNPAGIYALLKNSNVRVMIYKIISSDKTRLLRQLHREKNPNVDEIVRRYNTDKQDFDKLHFSYEELENENPIDLKKAIDKILEDINF